MKRIWTLVCCAVLCTALTACKSNAPEPSETEADAEAATETAAAEEAATPEPAAAPPKPADIPAPPDVAAPPDDAKRSESGLAWKVVQPGTGDKHPKEWDLVTVNYTGWTTDGRMFDSSVKRGKPAEFPLNRVIRGWTEGVQMMVEARSVAFGSRATSHTARPRRTTPTRPSAHPAACSCSTSSS